MVSKEEVGKFQLIIGIVLLVLGVIGFLSLIYFKWDFEDKTNSLQQNFQDNLEDYKNSDEFSKEFRAIGTNIFIDEVNKEILHYQQQRNFVLMISATLVLFSLIFISQGLVNKAEGYGK